MENRITDERFISIFYSHPRGKEISYLTGLAVIILRREVSMDRPIRASKKIDVVFYRSRSWHAGLSFFGCSFARLARLMACRPLAKNRVKFLR
jgi:hypothetical protein